MSAPIGSPPDRDFVTLRWHGDDDGFLEILDQTALPVEVRYLACRDVDTLFEAVRSLRVRGAPAIGVAAAYGVVLGMQSAGDAGEREFFERLDEVCRKLAASRPTAVNLFWALDRMRQTAESARGDASPKRLRTRLFEEARRIHDDDVAMCRAIGRHGAELLHDGDGVLTHCNAGALATAGAGTALAVLYEAADQGKRLRVFVDETRPLLQGARLTAWELARRGFDVTLICDNMAARVMQEGRIQAVVVGADRIAANGDAANKIGTYGVAVAAAVHDIPFFIAAPSNTIDFCVLSGDGIPIEERSPREVTHGFGRQTAPDGVKVYNPAFDVTPARLISSIICERGVIAPVNETTIRQIVDNRV